MEFGSGYIGEEQSYHSSPVGFFGDIPFETMRSHSESDIEQPFTISEIGQSVTEGARFGTLLKTTTDAIRKGAGAIELSTQMGGGAESVGAEAYGKDAREALRDLARANEVTFTSVHTPVNIGNMSGYNPQERGFNDEYRKTEIEEVKRAIQFAADVGAEAVVVHTGEFQRDMSSQPWNKMKQDGTWEFLSYDEEPGRAILYLVDDRTGRLVTDVRKSQVVREPKFKKTWDETQQRYRWVDIDNKFLKEDDPNALFNRVPEWDSEHTRFKTERLTWDDFVVRAKVWNKYYSKPDGNPWTPEELYFRSQMETRILQSRGSSLYHGRFYDDELKEFQRLKKAFEFYEKLEQNMPVEEQWKLMQQDPSTRGLSSHFMGAEYKKPTEILKKAIEDKERSLRYIHEASSAADANAEETYETLLHVVPVAHYARGQTSHSYAEAGIYAMERTAKSKHAKKNVYVAPENIFPEMGYGSHPDELIELVKDSRKRMVNLLTSSVIDDPHKRRDEKGNLIQVENPFYKHGLSRDEAEQKAFEHIKSTIDVQHIGMWWKHFQPLQNESLEQRKERFNKWYLTQIEKLQKSGIMGHVHIVDSIGAGHSHLPVGQGMFPIKEALEYLKKKGFKGTMVSEAWSEDSMFGAGRQMTETWRHLGIPIRSTSYGGGGGGPMWTDIHHAYARAMQSPYFIFGAYSPSNDWQMWSQIPME